MTSSLAPQLLARRRAFAEGAPLRFRALTVQTTWTCNARCAMCYQSAGPRGSDLLGEGSLTVAELLPVIEQAPAIATLEPRFQLVGGEAMLRFDDCLALVSAAARAGFQSVSATTNAFWARRPRVAEERCRQLRDAGLTALEVSFDAWHLPWVSGDTVSNALLAGARSGLPVTLRLLTSRSHDAEATLAQLRPEALEAAALVHATTVASTGRAGRELPPGEAIPRGDLTETCHRDLSLTVNPAGDVYPCCSGLDQSGAFRFGNVRSRGIEAIARAMSASVLLRRVVFEGVASLLPLLQAEGVDVPGEHSSICSLCWRLFSCEDALAALRRHFPDEPLRPVLSDA